MLLQAATGGTAVLESECFWQSSINKKRICPSQKITPPTILIAQIFL